MSSESRVQPSLLWARVIVEATSDEVARSVWLVLNAFISRYGDVKLIQLRPYWKFPNNFELLVSIGPNKNRDTAFEEIRRAIGPATTALEDCSVIWAREQGARIIDPRVVWLSIEPMDDSTNLTSS